MTGQNCKVETCNNTIEVGVKKCSYYTSKQLMILAILAGAFTALGGFASSMGAHSIDNYSISNFVDGSLFSIGLILVLTCGGELFTGNVLTIQAYLQKRITAYQFFRNLVIVYIFNFLGVFIVSALIYFSGLLTSNNGKLLSYILISSYDKVSLSFTSLFILGILCNFLICLAVWGAYGTKNSVTKVILGYLAITVFIVSGFQNSIANMYYFSISLLAQLDSSLLALSGVSDLIISSISFKSVILSLIPATLGNLIGGILFVGVAYWAAYEYIPRHENHKKELKLSTPNKMISEPNTITDMFLEREDYYVISVDKHSRVYIPDTRKDGIIDIRYVDFESNYYCH